MTHTADFLAVDLGASSGRLMAGRWDGARFALAEVHRFANDPVRLLGAVYWNVLQLWQEVQVGLRRYAVEYGKHPASIGVDTWGLDYALLDARDRLLGSPYTYRDARTNGMVEQVTARVPRERIFSATGIQFMQINTLYQLFSMAQTKDPQLT